MQVSNQGIVSCASNPQWHSELQVYFNENKEGCCVFTWILYSLLSYCLFSVWLLSSHSILVNSILIFDEKYLSYSRTICLVFQKFQRSTTTLNYKQATQAKGRKLLGKALLPWFYSPTQLNKCAGSGSCKPVFATIKGISKFRSRFKIISRRSSRDIAGFGLLYSVVACCGNGKFQVWLLCFESSLFWCFLK